jgi:hypothetical protein
MAEARTTDLARQAVVFCEASIRDWTGRAVRMLAANPELAGFNFAGLWNRTSRAAVANCAAISGPVDRTRPGLAAEPELDPGQHLRRHQRRCAARRDPRGDQDGRARRHRAGQRRHGEAAQPGQEHPPVPAGLSQPCAGHQQHRVRQQPLIRYWRKTDTALDLRPPRGIAFNLGCSLSKLLYRSVR